MKAVEESEQDMLTFEGMLLYVDVLTVKQKVADFNRGEKVSEHVTSYIKDGQSLWHGFL